MALATPAETRQLLRPHASWQAESRLVLPGPVTEDPKDTMVLHPRGSVVEIIVVRIRGYNFVWVSTSRSRRHGHRHEAEELLYPASLVGLEDS